MPNSPSDPGAQNPPASSEDAKTNPGARAAAYAVHILTASGILCGYIALLYATDADWTRVFIWLGIAFILDGIDGPLARALGVEIHAPRISGKQLDLIVDYFNYVVIPALIISQSSLVPVDLRFPASAAILLTSLYHFSDQNSKTADGFFMGFPAIWNVVIFYMLVFRAGPEMATLVVAVFAVLTFVPLPWLHPIRATHPRRVNIAVTVMWFGAAAMTLWSDFAPGPVVKSILVLAALYVIGVSLTRAAKPELFSR